VTDHLDSKNLVPFSKRRRSTFQLPAIRKDRDEEMLEQVDPDLRPEDEGLIRRYLHYADTLLGSPETPSLALVPGGPVQRPRGSADQLRPINIPSYGISSYGKPQVESAGREQSNGHESGEALAPEFSETRNQEVAEEQSKSDEQKKAEASSSLESQGANSTTYHAAEQTSPETTPESTTDEDDNGRAA